MLYFKGTGATELGAHFAREGATTSKRGLRHMRQVTKVVMEQSIANSPVDWKGSRRGEAPGHELEKSHRIREQYGAGGRIETTIEIGGMVGGVNVDLYAVWLHESFDWKLGPASRAKMMMSPKNKVGPLFLERALAEHDHEFDEILDELVEGLMNL
ncbi:hypothetical protein SAMN03159338_1602 [Sphingomonas sp. NFR04]|jgi:hypothetical protein|uniref:hypothetical protein n=1 Tax=Sphingomonas sp. NFR04 TaxID=1566283 RepID=UPI0008ED000A|nr:hypothetical protein [Sphingomonas sp. NFR04]SFJ50718.1 hypothetical protein SAMN03159338_1602 [Sphingomonas sp. NFR04]